MTTDKRRAIQERAMRVRYMREDVLRLSRELLGKSSGISPNTLQNWERTAHKGLTEEGARRLVHAYKIQGINCTVEWLMYGIGEKPLSPFQRQDVVSVEDEIIAKELQQFIDLNGDVMHTFINDDAMSPYLWPGDLVAGKRIPEKKIAKLTGLNCIVELDNGAILVRTLELNKDPGYYNLISANNNSAVKKVIENVQLKNAAPVIWMRRRMVKI